MQFDQQFQSDNLWLGMFHPMNHAIFHGFYRREINLLFESVYQGIRRRFMIGGGDLFFFDSVNVSFVPLKPMRSTFSSTI